MPGGTPTQGRYTGPQTILWLLELRISSTSASLSMRSGRLGGAPLPGGNSNTGSILCACRLHCSAGRRRLRSFSSPASPTRRRAHRGGWRRSGGKAPGAHARTAGRISRCPARLQAEAAGRRGRPAARAAGDPLSAVGLGGELKGNLSTESIHTVYYTAQETADDSEAARVP